MNAEILSREAELERNIEERTRELTTLLQVSRDVTSNLSLDIVLHEILDKLKTVVRYSNATICRLEGDTFYSIADWEGMRENLGLDIRFSALNFIDQRVMMTRKPLIIGDVHKDDTDVAIDFRAQASHNLYTYYKSVRNWMRVPLIFKSSITGLLTLHYHEPNYYTSRHADLAMAFAEHAAIAIENARLFEKARDLAAMEERQKLARELHDSVSQALYGIVLGTRTARKLLSRDPDRIGEPLDYISSLAEAGLAEMRALIFALRPESLQLEGLIAALTKQCDAVRSRHQLVVNSIFPPEPDIPIEIKEVFYRVAQEALHNIVKHARATVVELRLETRQNRVFLSIHDDGTGFDTDRDYPGHLGLISMRERVENAGGCFKLESTPGKGTSIEASITLVQ